MDDIVARMVKMAAKASKYSEEEILSHSRAYPLCYMRFIIFWQLSRMGWTHVRIGEQFGLNHATVYHGIMRVNEMISCRPAYKELNEIKDKFERLYKNMKTIYLSAPIGDISKDERYKERYAFFKKKEKYYTELGFHVLNPMDNGLPRDASIYEQMHKDYRLIDESDAVVLLENWNRSAGSHSELIYAISIGKDILIDKALTVEQWKEINPNL